MLLIYKFFLLKVQCTTSICREYRILNYSSANKRCFQTVSIVFQCLSTFRINCEIFEMDAMKILWFCVSLSLPLIICGQLSNALAKMNEISRRGGFINGVLKPSMEGYIAKGSASFTYRGKIDRNGHFIIFSEKKNNPQFIGTLRGSNKEVAMKVTLPNYRIDAKHEYEIYSYLGAINNSAIEAYGIPSVYYYGRWNGCYLLAITLLDSKFNERWKLSYVNEVDILIISREFVSYVLFLSRQLKNNSFSVQFTYSRRCDH